MGPQRIQLDSERPQVDFFVDQKRPRRGQVGTSKALRKHEEAKASSKKRSSSIFGWLSPNKRSRRGGEEEDDDNMDD